MLSDSEDDIPLSKKWKRAITKEKEAEEDRISALPDSLLLHILSFLSTKEVVRTCLLSKRWEFIWTELSEVDLRENSDDTGKIHNFVDWVGRMLAMCKGLNKFAVDFEYQECFAPNVNFWVYFAIKSKVKDFTLSCSYVYELPQMFYSYSSLTDLTVRYCVMAPRGIIAWGSLKSLSIDGVELLDCLMEKILSGCPVLKVLRLTECWGLNNLNIYSPNLTTLVIENIGFFRDKFLDISAPYLQVLSILNDDPRGQFRLSNASSVVQANLDLYGFFFKDIRSMNYIEELLERLQSVMKLELGRQCIEMVSLMEVNGWKLPLSTLRDLTLNVWRHEMSIPAVLGMLRSSPNLETLHIRGSWVSDEETMEALDTYEIGLKDCNMDLVASHLKTVKITDFKEQDLAGKPMLTLIQILLMNANVLEKMVINVDEDPLESPSSSTSADSTKIAKKLLTFPRASPKAVVVLT